MPKKPKPRPKKTWRERLDARISICPSCAHWCWDGRCSRCDGDAGL